MTIGVAMIARNGAASMYEALTPFRAKADEIAIVLGGASTDDTALIAREIAHVVREYDGPVAEDGALLNFAAARQQSFELLDTDWAIVVDADDEWHGLENLTDIIDQAEHHGSPAVSVTYQVGDAEFYQARIFKRQAGRWQGAIHEQFVIDREYQPLKTGALTVRQIPGGDRTERNRQNIAIGEQVLSNKPGDLRAIAHLIKDYLNVSRCHEALTLCNQYIDLSDVEPGRYNSEYLSVLEAKAECEIVEKQPTEALRTTLDILRVQPSGTAWSLMAEAALKSAHGSAGLLNLAILAADQALASGKSRTGRLHKIALSGVVPCQIKAVALYKLGRKQEALNIADLGLVIEPTNGRLIEFRQELSQELGVVA